MSASIPSMELPSCEVQRLEEIADLVSSVGHSRVEKRMLAWALKEEGYIPKLLQLFQVCENGKDTDSLHLLFDIVRRMLYLDEEVVFEVMFSDECILDVAGCLEYDPSLAQPESHREFLMKTDKRQEIIPTRDPEIRKKIRQTSRAEYIRSIILRNPPKSQRGSLSTLTAFIRRSKKEILKMLQRDEAFLSEIFAQLKDEATADEQRLQLVKLFREFCAFSLTFPRKRRAFLNTLARFEFLPTLKRLMGMNDLQVRSIATDILSYVVYFHPSMVLNFVLQEAHESDKNDQLLTVIIEQLINNSDPGLGGNNQLKEILYTLIDPRNMRYKANISEVFGFINFFYDHCIHILTAPLLADTSENSYDEDDYRAAERLALILEVLSFCVERYKYQMVKYVTSEDLLRRVLVLLKSKHQFLALAALRFMRRMIGLKDKLCNRYIIQRNLFEPVVNALLDNGDRSNLFNSALQELFDFILMEDIQSLIEHLVENFSAKLETILYVPTFQAMMAKYELEKSRQNKTLNSVPSVLPGKAFVRDERVSEAEEKPQGGEVEEEAAPTQSSGVPSTTSTPLARVMSPVKRGLFEIFSFPDESDEDDEKEAPPRKRARVDS
ncbi:serine/threonine-protein phosphatase 4 regulatory subunit 3-like [Myiozetetes cayanensis]|uniref:serine/threonine-protein phosphatase 4 regulatory subunit 3-like n=1 Tax=Myiozetetes cayanensis TaxID=478635 RepID=UPI00215F069E|nr:serine/threonine-protein phosphatase 4 regulatory subunit 3-like [Myiozetetes cayanensis]